MPGRLRSRHGGEDFLDAVLRDARLPWVLNHAWRPHCIERLHEALINVLECCLAAPPAHNGLALQAAFEHTLEILAQLQGRSIGAGSGLANDVWGA